MSILLQQSPFSTHLFCSVVALAILAGQPLWAGGNHPNKQMDKQNFVAAFTVTNNNDTGTGSLRQAILDANASQELM
ncbi:MAG: hypothetical protein R2795_24800 [Saprospiraceae bacterium]